MTIPNTRVSPRAPCLQMGMWVKEKEAHISCTEESGLYLKNGQGVWGLGVGQTARVKWGHMGVTRIWVVGERCVGVGSWILDIFPEVQTLDLLIYLVWRS